MASKIYCSIKEIPKKEQHKEAYQLLQRTLKKDYGIEELPAIIREEGGKPVFKDCPLHFNLSHTDTGIACVISDRPCGIDIQTIAKNTRVARKVCSEKEEANIKKSQEAEQLFTRYWTCKEAYVKQSGEGIRNDMKQLDFSAYDGEESFIAYGRYFICKSEESFKLTVCLAEESKADAYLCDINE